MTESQDDGYAAPDLFEAHPDPALYFVRDEESEDGRGGEGGDRDQDEDRGGDTLITAANPAFEETFDAPSTIVGMSVDAVAETAGPGELGERLSRGSNVDETVTCETADGRVSFRVRTAWVSGERRRGFLVYTPAGETAIIDDREGDRVEELAHVVSHELRNPLDSVRARVEAANETGDIDHLDTALRNLDRISSIISDLTTLAREGRLVGDRHPIDLTATVEEAWKTVDADDATLTITDDLGRVSADDSAVEHLLENLFWNAIEHTEGRVTVTVGQLDRDGDESSAAVDDRGFYVADDGPGIAIDDRDRVFEAGYTTDRQGTGLGLRIVERVAESHGWRVTVTDSEDGGARFEITGVDPVEQVS